jgi:hypothetical protein
MSVVALAAFLTTDSTLARRRSMYGRILLRPAYLSQSLDRPRPTNLTLTTLESQTLGCFLAGTRDRPSAFPLEQRPMGRGAPSRQPGKPGAGLLICTCSKQKELPL